MSLQPFDVQPIIQRLTGSAPLLRSVGGAADYQAINSLRDFPAPCAYVVLAREKAGSTPAAGHAPRGQVVPTSQIMVVTFAVVVAVRNYREQRGEQLADALKAVLGQTRDALVGWVPDVPGARACQLLQGDVQDYDAATLLWADVYQTQHSISTGASL